MSIYALSEQDVLQSFSVSLNDGLSYAQVKERHKKHGSNMLHEDGSVKWLHLLVRQFTNFLILILFAAAALSWILGDGIDAVAILAIVILNGLLGFVQEWKAENALVGLKKMLKPQCRVIREGRLQMIDAAQLVPGDIVLLESGESVPADMRILEAVNLKADESTLTGESLPVDKSTNAVEENAHITSRTCMVWMGTHIVNGNGTGVVSATGMNTEFGHIADLTGKIQETGTSLQKQLGVLAQQLTILIIATVSAVMLFGWLGGRPPMQMLMAGISLAVSAIPEGLPAVVTITLTLGVRIMARRKALLRHLQAVETLGATSVICTDKTGTLTKNEMTIQKLWLAGGEIEVKGVGYEPEGTFSKDNQTIKVQDYPDLNALLMTGLICNHAHTTKTETGWSAIGSPTEAAFIVAAQKAGLKKDHCGSVVCEFSFNSLRKRMSIIEKHQTGMISHVKGAPEVLLASANKILINGQEKFLDEAMREKIREGYKNFAKEGLRTLGLARKTLSSKSDITEEEAESELVFLGIAGIIDPPRIEAKDAITRTRQAGIRVIMITGDSPDTALAVARQIGLKADLALTGTDLKKLSDDALLNLLDQDIVFARTVPEDKHRIVKLLQSKSQLVAMTGDGVNDAPALKQADIGIAMGIRGTDVAKSASDLVLSDDNFASIVGAIEEGRRQYDNIRKSVTYLLSSNIGETLAVFVSILCGLPLILIPVQILWINLVTDSVTALSLSVEKAEKNIMQEPPRPINQTILDKSAFMILSIYGGYIGLAALVIFIFYLDTSYQLANTVAFTTLVILSNLLVLNFRSFDRPLYKVGFLANPYLLLAVISTIGMQLAVVYTPFLQDILNTVPMAKADWALILSVSLPLLIASDLYKAFKSKY